jgi:hypothetical protein
MHDNPLTILNSNIVTVSEKSRKSFHTLNCALIIIADRKRCIDVILPRVQEFNPKQRVLVILNDANFTAIENLLKNWTEQFELSRLYIADYSEVKMCKKNIAVFTYNKLTSGIEKLQKFTLSRQTIDELISFDRRRYENWNKNNLRVIISKFNMVTKIDEKTFDPATLGYVDGEILRIFSRYFNFTIDFCRMGNDGNRFGTRLPNGTFTGYLSLLEYGKVDLIAHARPVMDYKMKNSVFIQPSRQMGYVFVLPKKSWKDISLLKQYFSFFDWKIYLIIVAITFSIPITLFAMDKLTGVRCNSLVDKIFTVISIQFSVTAKIPDRWSSRWIYGSLALAFLVIGTLYSSLTIEFFYNADKYVEEINTIDDLVKSDYEIKFISSLTQLFHDIDEKYAPASHIFLNRLIKSAWKQFEMGEPNVFVNMNTTDDFIRARKYAIFEPINLAEELLGVHGDEIFYIKQTPYVFYNAMIIRRQLPMLSGELSEVGVIRCDIKMIIAIFPPQNSRNCS